MSGERVNGAIEGGAEASEQAQRIGRLLDEERLGYIAKPLAYKQFLATIAAKLLEQVSLESR